MEEAAGRPVIVMPTIRSNEYVKEFLDAWRDEFAGAHLIIVEDRPKKRLGTLLKQYREFSSETFDWRDIKKELGRDAWIIPRKTDCVRSFGFLKAIEHKPLFIVSMDDDVRPFQTGFLARHYQNLKTPVPSNYVSTTARFFPRGAEYGLRTRPDISHGGWLGVPDFDAETQTRNPSYRTSTGDFNHTPIGPTALYSMCGMNVAFTPSAVQYLYFGLQGGDYPVDRCGDIWAGFYAHKKGGCTSVTGHPYVRHERASNVWSNRKKERTAEDMTRQFINWLSGREVVDKEYFSQLEEAYAVWERLLEERL